MPQTSSTTPQAILPVGVAARVREGQVQRHGHGQGQQPDVQADDERADGHHQETEQRTCLVDREACRARGDDLARGRGWRHASLSPTEDSHDDEGQREVVRDVREEQPRHRDVVSVLRDRLMDDGRPAR